MKGTWNDDNDMKRDGNCNREDNCKYIDFSSLREVTCMVRYQQGHKPLKQPFWNLH